MVIGYRRWRCPYFYPCMFQILLGLFPLTKFSCFNTEKQFLSSWLKPIRLVFGTPYMVQLCLAKSWAFKWSQYSPNLREKHFRVRELRTKNEHFCWSAIFPQALHPVIIPRLTAILIRSGFISLSLPKFSNSDILMIISFLLFGGLWALSMLRRLFVIYWRKNIHCLTASQWKTL